MSNWHKMVSLVLGLGLLGGPVLARAQQPVRVARGIRAVQEIETAAVSFPLKKKVSEVVVKAMADGKNAGVFQNSIFCGRGRKGDNAWSGSVFAVEENGKKEIFGVVAAHALANFPTDFISAVSADYALRRNFDLQLFDRQGILRRIPAEVVWLSSPRMWDVALVKFSPLDEALFTPFALSEQLPEVGDDLQQQGFSQKFSVYIPHRRVLDITPLSFRTTMPLALSERIGLCGSPVVVAETVSATDGSTYQMVGVHTGSMKNEAEAKDIGFFTPSSFLRRFVEDYRTGGQVKFPVVLKGKEALSLAANEHIAGLVLLDNEGQEITTHKFENKFSYRKMEELVDTYGPHEIEFIIKRFQWNKQQPEYVEISKTSRRVKYNLRLGKIIWQRGYH